MWLAMHAWLARVSGKTRMLFEVRRRLRSSASGDAPCAAVPPTVSHPAGTPVCRDAQLLVVHACAPAMEIRTLAEAHADRAVQRAPPGVQVPGGLLWQDQPKLRCGPAPCSLRAAAEQAPRGGAHKVAGARSVRLRSAAAVLCCWSRRYQDGGEGAAYGRCFPATARDPQYRASESESIRARLQQAACRRCRLPSELRHACAPAPATHMATPAAVASAT